MGGNANAYDYCTAEPINCTDLDGRWGWHWKKFLKRAATVTGFVAVGACILATAGLCGVATALAIGASAAWNGYQDGTGAISGRRAMSNFGVDAITAKFRAVRSFRYRPRHLAGVPKDFASATRGFSWTVRHHPVHAAIWGGLNLYYGKRSYDNGW